MQRPIIKPGSGLPNGDGDINLYVSPEVGHKDWFNTKRRVVFVNGMANSKADHRASALGLSTLQGCPAVGVFNEKGTLFADLGQCILDKATFGSVEPDFTKHSSGFAGWLAVVLSAYELNKLQHPSLTLVDYVHFLLRGNKATQSLYAYLVTLSPAERQATKIYCHSQGNLITSNALTGVAFALGLGAIAGMEVNGFGSPCRYWPPGLKRTNYAFTFDPVSWLDYRIAFDNVKVGFVAGHGFDLYRKYDGEFVVNRFRWGSFGLTASMDEKGLAHFCADMGNNPPRLIGVFQRLMTRHWSDTDDVAFYYTKRMREKYPHVIRQIAKSSPEFIKILCKCMEGGWTTGSERAQINYLEAL
ncbi:hypothetical protein IV417_15850 [Alphaproteobacteria bacterium KMM 3653]|uniref:Uncharacterized protein n=1 Tax=Harenicola maris TaxID=2841044 RepID=A0AAP2CW73_9RHOB|nr:hypothetical protein [Harenicola maris]